MIKNATFFRISNLPATFGPGAADLCFTAFEPCGPTQEKSVGWVPPRGEDHGALIESVNGQVVIKLMTEVRKVPSQTLADEVKRRADDIETTTGRKPGKKEKREIADDAKLALLPMAFTARSATTVIIDPASKLVLVDSTTTGKVDEVLTALVKSVDGIAISQIATNTSPSSAMAMWLMTKESPNSFTVDRECELKASDESKAVVKYGRHPLDIDEVAQHIAQGKIPTKLALTWNDRVSFVLTSSMQLKKLAFLDCVFENRGDTEADAFDADVCIVTGEMSSLFVNLVEVLGGEVLA